MSQPLLSRKRKELGVEECNLNLNLLYPNEKDRQRFELKWNNFYKSDSQNPNVFRKTNNNLVYLSESWIPTRKDDRPPVLLLFGNPASHSVVARMYFAYEGNKREHRVWRIFREISLLHWHAPLPTASVSLTNTSKLLKKKFYDLKYDSPFRLAMAVYYSMPSAPSEPQWSGVAGLYRLFGKKAMDLIEIEEQKRIKQMIKQFMPKKGAIIAFQKDAYNGVRGLKSPGYSLKMVLDGKLKAKCKLDSQTKVFGVPPTRFLQGHKAKQVLKDSITRLQNRS